MWNEKDHPRGQPDNSGKFAKKDDKSSSDIQDERQKYSDSVTNRIKWAKENGVDLPLNADGSIDDIELQQIYNSGTIHLPDETLPRSLSARWANEDIRMPNGKIAHFVEGSKLHHIEVFAGKGCQRKIDEIERLVSDYKDSSSDKWQKVKGIGQIEYNGEQDEAEIHWYQEPSVGRVEFKFKRYI